MASKSRRRRKHSLQSKKGKRRGISTVTAAQQQPVAQTYKPAAPSVQEPAQTYKPAAPSVQEPAQTYKPAAPPVQEPAPTVARYPNIATDIRRTGILAGILLTALVVLAFVLS